MKRFIAGFVVIAFLAVGPWVISSAYMETAGIVVAGKVLAKREAILMPGGDTWRHIFEITYEYRPLDVHFAETVIQRVDEKFYRTLQVGSTVQVRYSPSRLLRSFAGMGLYLDGASRLSRLRYGPPDQGDIVKAGALALAAVFGLIAYWRKNKTLGVVAFVTAGICFPVVLVGASGMVLFPALFWASRRNPGRGYGVALLTTIALSGAVVYWRIPRQPPLPPGPVRSGTATVRQARVADEVWSDAWETSGGRRVGEKIGQPFQMVDLEFTPEGATGPIHVLDRFDLNSLSGLHEGALVPIEYSTVAPDSARIVGVTRNYARQIAVYLLLLAYGVGALVTFVLVPIKQGVGKLFHSSRTLKSLTDPSAAISRIAEISSFSQLPADDPRRKRLEALLRIAKGNDEDKGPRKVS